MATCNAYQSGDSMYCGGCGLQWDANDPDPPRCGKEGISKRAENLCAIRRRFEVQAVKEGLGVGRDGANEYFSFETRTAWKWFQVGRNMTRRDYAAEAV